MSKLYRARSLLHRRQILQENIRWKALDEIYKIYMLLHRSDLNISENFRQTFSHRPLAARLAVRLTVESVHGGRRSARAAERSETAPSTRSLVAEPANSWIGKRWERYTMNRLPFENP